MRPCNGSNAGHLGSSGTPGLLGLAGSGARGARRTTRSWLVSLAEAVLPGVIWRWEEKYDTDLFRGSLFWLRRHCLGADSVEDYLALEDAADRENGRPGCDEHGSLVSFCCASQPVLLLTLHPNQHDDCSAGTTSFLKITSLDAIGNVDLSELSTRSQRCLFSCH